MLRKSIDDITAKVVSRELPLAEAKREIKSAYQEFLQTLKQAGLTSELLAKIKAKADTWIAPPQAPTSGDAKASPTPDEYVQTAAADVSTEIKKTSTMTSTVRDKLRSAMRILAAKVHTEGIKLKATSSAVAKRLRALHDKFHDALAAGNHPAALLVEARTICKQWIEDELKVIIAKIGAAEDMAEDIASRDY
jgi:enamine deaminase RidA (YjgF/YER057c/UK114 family)